MSVPTEADFVRALPQPNQERQVPQQLVDKLFHPRILLVCRNNGQVLPVSDISLSHVTAKQEEFPTTTVPCLLRLPIGVTQYSPFLAICQ